MLLREFAEATDDKYDNPLQVPAERVAAAVRIPGKCIYLGILHGHFGHFLVESLPRAWALLDADRDVPVLFHYPHLRDGPLFPDPNQLGLPSFISIVFEVLGIRAGRLVLANQDIVVDELLVPRAQFRLGKHGIGATGLPLVYDHIREELQRRSPRAASYPSKLYLTRTRLPTVDSQKLLKSIANERDIEALFQARGFEIVAPEQLSFEEQIALVSNATQIAGTTGSALHMILFNGRSDTQVIAVDWRNSRTQYILEAARGLRAAHIYCFNGRAEGNRPLADIEVVERALGEIFSDGGRSELPVKNARAGRLRGRRDAVSPAPRRGHESALSLPTRWALDLFCAFERLKPEKSLANFQSLTVWALLASIQNALSVEGNILETSANASNQLFSLLMARATEKTVVTSSRSSRESGQAQVLPLSEELETRAQFLDTTGATGWADLQPKRFRWVHVDLDPPDRDLRPDMSRFAGLVGDDGILTVSNFFDAASPDTTAAVLDFVAAEPDWKILLVAPALACLVKAVSRARYAQLLREGAQPFLAQFGLFRILLDVAMGSDTVCSIKGSPHRLINMLKKGGSAPTSRAAPAG
jgi:hypothetical protein